MIDIKPILYRDKEHILDFLALHQGNKVKRETYEQIFEYRWLDKKPNYGFQAVDGNKLVGVLCGIYSRRQLSGRERLVCVPSTWYVLRGYRGRNGIDVLKAFMKMPEIVLVAQTSSYHTIRIIKHLGWRILDDRKVVIRTADIDGKSTQGEKEVTVITDPNEILLQIDGDLRRICEFHREYQTCHFMLLSSASENCLIVANRVYKEGDTEFIECLYVSDRKFLTDHLTAIARRLLEGGKRAFSVDSRFLVEAREDYVLEEISRPRMYFDSLEGRQEGNAIEPHQLSHLYGETVLLNLKLP